MPAMDRRGPLAQLLVFVAVLVGINLIAYIFNLNFRVSIIGSIVASIAVTAIMRWLQR